MYKRQVQHSLDCGVDSVAISISTSDIHIVHKLRTDREWVLSNMTKAVQFAKKAGMYVSVNAEDASRSELEFLLSLIHIFGAAKMAQITNRHPAELKNAVTSPAGTTSSALRILEDAAIRGKFIAAVAESARRAREMAEEMAGKMAVEMAGELNNG